MSDAAVTMDLQSNIACSTQEAVNLVRHLDLDNGKIQTSAERQILEQTRTVLIRLIVAHCFAGVILIDQDSSDLKQTGGCYAK